MKHSHKCISAFKAPSLNSVASDPCQAAIFVLQRFFVCSEYRNAHPALSRVRRFGGGGDRGIVALLQDFCRVCGVWRAGPILFSVGLAIVKQLCVCKQ